MRMGQKAVRMGQKAVWPTNRIQPAPGENIEHLTNHHMGRAYAQNMHPANFPKHTALVPEVLLAPVG